MKRPFFHSVWQENRGPTEGDLVLVCSEFLSEYPHKLNEAERQRIDSIIEKFEENPALSKKDALFLGMIYKRSKAVHGENGGIKYE